MQLQTPRATNKTKYLAVSRPTLPVPIKCPMDAKICSDGSTVTRTGPKCQFPACPSPSSAVSCPLPPVEVTCQDSEVPMRKSESTCGYVCSPILPSTF